MDHETTNYQTNHQFRRLPKGERRVRFADSMGMELVSIFLFDLINNYYFASTHNHHQLPPPKTIPDNKFNTTISSGYHNNKSTLNNNYHYHLSPSKASSQNNNYQQQQQQQYYHSLDHNHHHQQQQQQQKQQQQQQQYQQNNHQQQQQQQLQQQQQSNNNNNKQISSSTNNNINSNQIPTFICEFTQPISLVSFKERVKLNKIHLETCSVNSRAGHTSVSCIIRVSNVSYDKSVIVRYSTDEWHTHTDSLASYKPGSCDGWSDKFTSAFSITNQVKQFQVGQRIMFAIRITYDGDKVYWDNNGGLNYTIKRV